MKLRLELKEFKEISEQVGLPQTAVAKHLGISAPYLNRIFSGAVIPAEDLIGRIRDLRERLKKTGLIAV